MIKIIKLLIFFTLPIWGLDTVVVDESTEEINLSSYLDYYLDDSKAWRIEEISKLRGLFYPNQKDYLSLNFKNSSVWVHFRIKNISKQELEFFITVPLPALDYAEFFSKSSSQKWVSSVAGDTIPVNKWSIREYIHPTFKIEIPPQTETSYFLNLQNTSYIITPIYLQSLNKKESYENRFIVYERFLYVVVITINLFALYMYFKTKQIVFLFYILAILNYYLNTWIIQGRGYKILWSNSPEVQNRSQIFFLAFSLIASIYLTKEVFKNKKFFVIGLKVKTLFEIISFALFCLAFLCIVGIAVQIRIYVFNANFFLFTLLIIFLLFKISETKEKILYEYYFLFGLLSTFGLGILNALLTLGVLPYSPAYHYSLTLFSPICFSFILYSLKLYSEQK